MSEGQEQQQQGQSTLREREKAVAATALQKYKVTSEGERVIAASKRADGSLRKEIRIREGYVPPDEQFSYQSRVAQMKKDKMSQIPGLDPEDLKPTPQSKSAKKNAKRRAAKKAANSGEGESSAQG